MIPFVGRDLELVDTLDGRDLELVDSFVGRDLELVDSIRLLVETLN